MSADDDLSDLLLQFAPSARDHLRGVMIRDQADRGETCKMYGWPQTFAGSIVRLQASQPGETPFRLKGSL